MNSLNRDQQNKTERWEERYKQTKLFKQGGSCWECCEYEELVDEMRDFISQLLSDVRREEREKFLEILGEDETPNLENLLVTHDSCDSEKCFENQTRNEFRKELKSKLALTTAEESIKKLK